jgi:hypothetical protein
MSERGQRTKLEFGGVSAAVTLLKTSGKPKEARHDVMWPEEGGSVTLSKDEESVVLDPHTLQPRADPLGGSYATGSQDATPSEPLYTDSEEPYAYLPAYSNESGSKRIGPRRGVRLEDGEFIDLTDELALIDERTKLDGMSVVCTVASASVPRERVRDAHWIASSDPQASRVLALLSRALKIGRASCRERVYHIV